MMTRFKDGSVPADADDINVDKVKSSSFRDTSVPENDNIHDDKAKSSRFRNSYVPADDISDDNDKSSKYR